MANNKPDTESSLVFPCKFPIKVIGKVDSPLESTVLGIIAKYCPDFTGPCDRRLSRDGKYLALTLTVNAVSKTQMDAIYLALTQSPDVIMAL